MSEATASQSRWKGPEPGTPHLLSRDHHFADRVLSRHPLSDHSQCCSCGGRGVGGHQMDLAGQARHRPVGHCGRGRGSGRDDANVYPRMVRWRRRETSRRQRVPCRRVIGSEFPAGHGSNRWRTGNPRTLSISASSVRARHGAGRWPVPSPRPDHSLWSRHRALSDRHHGPAMARNVRRPPFRNRR